MPHASATHVKHMIITSKIRAEFYGKSVFLCIAFTLMIGAAFLNSFKISMVVHWLLSFLVSMLICTIAHLVVAEGRQYRIEVNEAEINVYKLFSKMPLKIMFVEIIDF